MLNRLPQNPILQPRPENGWESLAVFNTAALYLDGKVHLLYRAIGHAGLSVLGYASSRDGVHIDERLDEPVYVSYPLLDAPKGPFLPYKYASGNSICGCEDPRLVHIEDTIYMLYTAFDGMHPPAVALTSISVADFLNKKWRWQQPIMLSKIGEAHKNWTLFPEKLKGEYALLHSISPGILIEYLDNMDFKNGEYILSKYRPTWREGCWDNWIRGIGAPPIKTTDGWLVLYHAMDVHDPNRYKIGAKLLSLEDPTRILYRMDFPILAPDAEYENAGLKSGVVYTCGAAIVGDNLLVYYGGADTVVCVASVHLETLLNTLKTYVERLPVKPHFQRAKENPILKPMSNNQAIFNPSVLKTENQYHMVYRTLSFSPDAPDQHISSIGYIAGTDRTHFKVEEGTLLVTPEYDWEQFGCEDPRMTFLDGQYYIFYTALSKFPFCAEGIQVGVAITKDFKTIDAKYHVTQFNSKAMALFPERINGKMVAVLSVDTDRPPAKIAIAVFDKDSDLISEGYWANWHGGLWTHTIPLLKNHNDHVEVGAAPIKTPHGWLLVYSYIYGYLSEHKIFTIQAVLLDLDDPKKVLGHTKHSLLSPEKEYELKGYVDNIVFPSSVILDGDEVLIYYGAADTYTCLAVGSLKSLINEMLEPAPAFIPSVALPGTFERWSRNPILAPQPEFAWEARSVFNPAAIYEDGKVHILYRAMGWDDTSVFGYASSTDGATLDHRLPIPVYVPTASFEQKKRAGNSGCEDPRMTRLGDKIYVFYTAYDGYLPRVAFTSIKVSDFIIGEWNWIPPKVITSEKVGDKDACLFPEKINGQYVILNRPSDSNAICINFLDDLDFNKGEFLHGKQPIIKPELHTPLVKKVGISTPPMKTDRGWLMFYHWVTFERVYETGALLLDLNDPTKIISKTGVPLLTPEMQYEKVGDVNNVVFPCGSVIIGKDVFLYYGGADLVIGVCKMKVEDIFKKIQL